MRRRRPGKSGARRARLTAGYTLVELITAMTILMTVLTALVTLFTSGLKAEVELDNRFQAQQEVRLAADRMRREVHCASAVTFTSAASVTVTLPATCPTAGGAQATVLYDTQLISTNRYRLRRAGVQIADYLTSGSVFSYVAPSTASLGKLHLDFPVNLEPGQPVKQWRLVTDVVLRNTTRV